MNSVFFDQIGRNLNVNETPKRIISLVPSITELLCDIDLIGQLVGRTKFCIHPKEALKAIPIVGGTKQVHLDRIEQLQPDLIIANKEENQKDQIEALAEKYPVWISDVPHFEGALDMIAGLGKVLRKETACRQIIQQSKALQVSLSTIKQQKAIYLIWRDPYMTIGKDTYIHDLLRITGFENVFGEQTRYPIVSIEEMKTARPDVILLSSEPFPFKEKHIAELAAHFPNIPIQLVDGEAFSWYGTRFIKTVEYLRKFQ